MTDDPLASLLAKLEAWSVEGRDREARDLESRLVDRAGGDVRLWTGLGDMRARLGRPSAAAEAFERASSLAPTSISLKAAQAGALARAGRRPDAVRLAAEALGGSRLRSSDVAMLAGVLLECERPELAIDPLRRIATGDVKDAAILYLLAACERQTGDVEAARRRVAAVLRLDPGHGPALWMRSDTTRATVEANHVDDLHRLAVSGDPYAAYALVKECEDLGDVEGAFVAADMGARIVRPCLTGDPNAGAALMRRLQLRQGSEAVSRAAAAGNRSAAPLFVIGLPRSGTSLVSRLLEAHPDVRGLGEPPGIDRALHDIAAAHGARDSAEARDAALSLPVDEIGAAYLRLVEDGSPRRTVDKGPLNILNVGVIAAALPQARVVLVDRDPRDAGWAVFKTLFAGDAYPWSYDLRNTGRHIAAYRRLADHWATALPQTVVRIAYEDVVADLETQARRLVAACDLPWDDRCLRFHELSGPATSASALQVRRPVYASSVEAWRRYASHLAPLIEGLEDEPVIA